MIIVKKLILFALVILTISCPFLIANKYAYHRLVKSKVFKFTSNIDTLILGDSHSETSLDPKLIPGAYNVALSGESLFFTYNKLKFLIERNPGVLKNVVLAFSYHNISKQYQDESMFGDVKASSFISSYYKYLDYESKLKLAKSKSFVLYYLKYDVGFPFMEYKELPALTYLFNDSAIPSGLGGFHASESVNLDQKRISEKVKLYYFDDNLKYSGYSQTMIDYLDRIASLCHKNDIRLYLYNSPLYFATRRLIPGEAYEKYDSVVQTLKNRFPNVIFVDMSRDTLPDSYFQDGDHLNKAGASVASRKLYNLLHGEGQVGM